MAQNAPTSIDVQDIQFKLHDRSLVFPESPELKSLVSLLAVSSTKGLLFAGNPNAKELKVIKLKEIVDYKSKGQDLSARIVALPGEPKAIACSCDGSLLAVNFTANNTAFLQVFQVDSFLTPKITSLYNVPISPESQVFALQLLWNPVIANSIAIILNDGSVTMFTLNPGGNYDKFTLAKENQVKSGCWSPKGKQIVFGFAEGKLQQFKPNLQPARAIVCPPGIHSGPFDCIAVHWLSTFQFAAIFLQRGEEMCPSLFIVNAPKVGNPSYINYYDICYSAPGPRTQQLTFTHIGPWNLLLVSSANGVEVGILGTKESGENPTWQQYTLLDEARIEMPLTEAKDETYPIGFALDTSSSHQTKMGEQLLPVMPMVHVLSTHGHLVSFNFLNLTPAAANVCSPPPPLNDTSGQFRSLKEILNNQNAGNGEKKQVSNEMTAQAQGALNDMTFSLGSNVVTSTPAIKEKPMPMFGGGNAKPSTGFGFGAPPTAAAGTAAPVATKPATGFGFGGINLADTTTSSSSATTTSGFGIQASAPTFGGFGTNSSGFATAKPLEKPTINSASEASNRPSPTENNKPLYTVPPTFKAPPVIQPSKTVAAPPKANLNSGDFKIDEVVKQLLAIQIDAFENEINQFRQQSQSIMENLGNPEEIKSYTKQLNDLQEIIEQANDHEFEQDVQTLRQSMNESYAMLAECRTKLDMYNNPNLTRLTTASSADPTNRRQLTKLQSMATTNQTQLNQLNLLLDAQWTQYQDVVRRNTKNHMHIPCLDGIYQRMSKLKDLLSRQRTKLNHIKSKLKQKGLTYKPPSEVDVTTAAVGALTNKNQSTMESLADSILSMSLSQVVSQSHAKLSEDKLQAIRNFTKQQQQIAIIKPKRPDRIGLKSEVILETKLQNERKQKEQNRFKQQQQQQQQQQLQHHMQQQQQQHQLQQQFSIEQKSNAISIQQKQMSAKPSMSQSAMGMQKPQQQQQQQQQQQPQPLLAKPTASKPALLPNATFTTPVSSTTATSGLNFGNSSSFVKTSGVPSANIPTKFEESSRPLAASTPFPAFGGATTGLSFGLDSKVVGNQKVDGKENVMPANTPISFSAKVIGGNDAKSGPKSGNSTAQEQGFTSLKPSSVADNSKGDQLPKTFSFGGITSNLPTVASGMGSTPTSAAAAGGSATTLTFGGFGAISKSSASTTTAAVSSTSSSGGGVFSSAMFGSSSTMPSSFTALSSAASGSAVPFGGATTTFSFNTNSKATTETTTTAAATITTSTTAASKVSGSNETKTNDKPAAIPFGTTTGFTLNSSNLESNKTPGNSETASKTGSETKPITSEAAEVKPPTTDPTENILGSLNICKPETTKTSVATTKSSVNIFSGFGATTSEASSAVGGPFSFVSAAGSGASGGGEKSFAPTSSTGFTFGSSNLFGKSETTTATTKAENNPTVTQSAAVTAVSSSANTAVSSSTNSSSMATTTAPVSSAASTFSFGSASGTATGFGSLSLGGSTAPSTGKSAATSSAPVSAANIFGGTAAGSIFGQSSTNTTCATPSIFGGNAATASSGLNLMASTGATATPVATPTAAGSSIFGATAAVSSSPSGGSIFGGIPKPDQSVFGSSTGTAPTPAGTGLFAAAAAATKPPAATGGGGSIFGGTGFGAPTAQAPASSGGSIFGGASSGSPFGAPSNTSAASIFGGAAVGSKPPEGGNIFGSPTQQSGASGGSLFGKSTFGQPAAAASPQSGGSIFGGGAATQPSAGGFGSTAGSIFGGGNASNNPASGGSIFGAAAANTAPAFGSSNTTSGFGSFSQPSTGPAFGSPGGGFGAPAAGGAFGSPQQTSAFAKPVFGGPATFGSPPAFGAQPTFGGAPTFGSPKGFGTFGATSPTAGGFGAAAAGSAGAAAPKGNIFETLGSTDSGLSFGNLAHNTQQPAQQKPAFGGSSFMSYRS